MNTNSLDRVVASSGGASLAAQNRATSHANVGILAHSAADTVYAPRIQQGSVVAEMNRELAPNHYGDLSRSDVFRFIPDTATRLLDIGCWHGGFGGSLKTNRSISVDGVEMHADAAVEARKRLDEVFEIDLEQDREWKPERQYTVITLLDVLEHLQDPWALLRRVKSWLTPDGVVVISVPNLRFYPVLGDLFWHGRFTYTRVGVLDRTHLRFFTKNEVKRLVEDSGLRCVQIEGINASALPTKWRMLNLMAGGRFEDARYMQFAAVASL